MKIWSSDRLGVPSLPRNRPEIHRRLSLPTVGMAIARWYMHVPIRAAVATSAINAAGQRPTIATSPSAVLCPSDEASAMRRCVANPNPDGSRSVGSVRRTAAGWPEPAGMNDAPIRCHAGAAASAGAAGSATDAQANTVGGVVAEKRSPGVAASTDTAPRPD